MNVDQITLGDLCEFKYGDSLPERKRIPGSIPVYGSNGVVGYHSQSVTQGETIIVGRKGSIGEVHYSDGPCFPIDTTYYISETKRNCHLKWLYYILRSLRLTDLNKSSAVPGLNRNDAYEKRIVFPPLPIQKQIAAILEKAEAAREKRRQANQLTEQFLQSAFLEMFGDPLTNPKGWDMVHMRDLCDIKRGASPRPIDKWMGGTVPWIKIGDGSGNSSLYIESTKDFVTEEGAARSVAVPKGSLIFANCGISLGFARILKISGCIHDGWLALSNLRKDLNNVYLLSVLNEMTEYFRRIAPGGTTTKFQHIHSWQHEDSVASIDRATEVCRPGRGGGGAAGEAEGE